VASKVEGYGPELFTLMRKHMVLVVEVNGARCSRTKSARQNKRVGETRLNEMNRVLEVFGHERDNVIHYCCHALDCLQNVRWLWDQPPIIMKLALLSCPFLKM
jgi:hypothetical protein